MWWYIGHSRGPADNKAGRRDGTVREPRGCIPHGHLYIERPVGAHVPRPVYCQVVKVILGVKRGRRGKQRLQRAYGAALAITVIARTVRKACVAVRELAVAGAGIHRPHGWHGWGRRLCGGRWNDRHERQQQRRQPSKRRKKRVQHGCAPALHLLGGAHGGAHPLSLGGNTRAVPCLL